MKDNYVYPDTYVLINKLDIRDSKKLDEKENALIALNLINLLTNPIKIKSVFDIKIIHKLLFSDLYEWAGENRKMNMYKDEPILNGLSVNYSDYRNIDSDLKELDIAFKSVEWNRLSKKETINTIVQLISKLWKIHCFSENR